MRKLIQINSKKCLCRIEEVDYPAVGFGTWQIEQKAIEEAIRVGYRILDTATIYRNFDFVMRSLAGKERRHFYINSKVWHDAQTPKDLQADLESTLRQLKTDYLDAYFVHWPNSQIPIEQTLGAMEKLRQAGKIRHIGLSNVTANHLKRALEVGIPIQWVQVEMHPLFCDRTLLEFCKKFSISIQAWRPLGKGLLQQDPLLLELGQKYGKTTSQIALRWSIQHDCLPLPGSNNRNHIRENFDMGHFSLSSTEMERIDQRAFQGIRFRSDPGKMGFRDEFDFTYEECWPKQN